MRVKIAVRAANADRNAAYFGPDRGATIYSHTADIRLPFAQKVISTNDREALHVIDALCSHETDLNIQEHFVDTNGFTTHVFALCAMLGFRFAPRIRDVLDQRLFTVGAPEHEYGVVEQLLKGRANLRLILEELLDKHGDPFPGRGTVANRMRRCCALFMRERVHLLVLDELGNFIDSESGRPAGRRFMVEDVHDANRHPGRGISGDVAASKLMFRLRHAA